MEKILLSRILSNAQQNFASKSFHSEYRIVLSVILDSSFLNFPTTVNFQSRIDNTNAPVILLTVKLPHVKQAVNNNLKILNLNT